MRGRELQAARIKRKDEQDKKKKQIHAIKIDLQLK